MRDASHPRKISLSIRFLCVLSLLALPLPEILAQPSSNGGNSAAIANVQSFGADPSGNGDSTQAFVRAIATAKAIYVPSGNYKITNHDTLVLTRPSQEIFGDGPKASVLNYAGPCQSQIPGDATVLSLHGPDEVVRDLGVTSHLPQKCIMIGIQLKSDRGLVKNVEVSQMWHAGVVLHGTYNSVIDSDIQYCYYGVAGGGDRQLVRHTYISNHYSTSNEARPWTQKSMYWDGIDFEGLKDTIIDSNTVEDNGQSGIYTGGNHTASSGNVITNNYVRHNRNEGIDQGVTGAQNRQNNYIGHLVIVGNNSVDNFRHDIWLNEVDGAVVTWNTAEHTPDYANWWKLDAHSPNNGAIPCELAQVAPGSKSDGIIFVGNTCSQQSDGSKPALVMNPGQGSGNVLGNNIVHGNHGVPPSVDRKSNVIMPERDHDQ